MFWRMSNLEQWISSIFGLINVQSCQTICQSILQILIRSSGNIILCEKKEWLYLDSITIRIKIKRLYIHDKKYIYEEIKEFFSSLLLGAIWNKSSCHHQLLRRAIRLPRHPLPPTRPTARWKMPMGLIPAVQFAKKHTQYPKFLAVFILFVNPVSRNFKKLQTKSAVLSAIKTHS